jgi:hypothetical protein
MTHTEITLEKDGNLRIYNIEELAPLVVSPEEDAE